MICVSLCLWWACFNLLLKRRPTFTKIECYGVPKLGSLLYDPLSNLNFQYHTKTFSIILKHLAWYRVIQIEFSGTCCIILENNLDLLVRKCTTLNVLVWYWTFKYNTECFSMTQGHTIKTLLVWAWYSIINTSPMVMQIPIGQFQYDTVNLTVPGQ